MPGFDYVMQVAFPFWIANPKNDSDMLTSAVEGTLRVLRVAKKIKTLAEQAAWDVVNENKGSTGLDLAVIGPGGVFGPPEGDDYSGHSLAVLTRMLDGKVWMVPDATFLMVDIRDVAHLRGGAVKNKTASGKEPNSFADAAQILLYEG